MRRFSSARLDYLFSTARSGTFPAANTIFRVVHSTLIQERLSRLLWIS
jgi:hypothetical protein